MTVYQELQLSSAGSKDLIRKTENTRERITHSLIYIVKVFLTLAFCMAVVTAYAVVFGKENSTTGVVILLALLVLRAADFGIHTTHGVGVIFLLFGILSVGPKLSNGLPIGAAFLVNVICILGILILSCHNVVMSNHSTFVLGYLLLQGYDVDGSAYLLRIAALASGAVICAVIFYKNQKERQHKRGFLDLFREIQLQSIRTQWYLKFTFGISTAMLLASAMHLPRVMWVGIACMSTMMPFTKDSIGRVKQRIPFNIVGGVVFLILYHILPPELYANIGILGGIGVGFSATYAYQTVFNTFGALSIAANLFGPVGAVMLRILCNVFGSLYNMIFDQVGTLLLNCIKNSNDYC